MLLIRLSAIGDIVMASPLIRAARRAYPDAHLAWLVQSEAKDLLEANQALDEVIVWPRGEWRRLWRERHWLRLAREVATFVRALRRRRFDLAIDLQGLLKSGVWGRLSGAPQRIGLGSKEGSARLMTRLVPRPSGDPRIGSEYRRLAETLGWDVGDFEMDVALSDPDRAFAADLVRRERLESGYAVLCPFTTRPQKHWVGERWAELGRALHAGAALRPVILGGPGDVAAARELAQAGEPDAVDLTGRTSLRQAAAVIAGARLVVGVDTGLSHIALAMKVPTVLLFGSTRPYLDTGRPNAEVIYKNLPCAPCRRRPTCGGAYTCMASIGVDEVLGVARRLLK